jgi:hypothetical protein
MDSNFRFRARRLRHFLPRSKPGLSADCNHSVGIDSGDRVLPTFGDLGGAVGPTDHPMGRRVRPQCDQIRPAGSGIKPAASLPADCAVNHTVRRGIDIVRPSPRGAAPPCPERGEAVSDRRPPKRTDGSNPSSSSSDSGVLVRADFTFPDCRLLYSVLLPRYAQECVDLDQIFRRRARRR